MSVSTIKMTAKQFLELGEDPPGVRLELVDGEIAVHPSPTPSHSYTTVAFATILGCHIDDHRMGQLFGRVNSIFGKYDVRQPDVVFVRNSRLEIIGEKAIEGPPDLLVEVLSPDSATVDRKDKFNLYAQGKVQHYWIVDPAMRTIEAYRRVKGKYTGRVRGSGSDVVQLPPFPKLKIPLAKLWRPKA